MSEPKQDSMPTRHSLLNRLKDWGDDRSWREFFEMYWELIYNIARKAGLTDSEAQEVVQETIIGVAKKIGGFETDARRGSFKAWLLRQTRWRIADQFRKRDQWERGTADTAGGLPSLPGDDTGTGTVNRIPDPASLDLDQAWNSEWEQHTLRIALDRVKAQVSVKQFQMFDLHTIQGLSVSETARALGTSMAAVYMAKSRVGRLLRREAAKLRSKVDSVLSSSLVRH